MQRDPHLVRFSSVQFRMVSVRSEKPICTPPRLSEVPPTLPLKRLQCFVSLTMALSRPFKEDHPAFPLSTPLSYRCDVLGFVPAGSVSSFSTLPHLEQTQLASMYSTQHTLLSSITVDLALRVGSLVLLSSQPLFYTC